MPNFNLHPSANLIYVFSTVSRRYGDIASISVLEEGRLEKYLSAFPKLRPI